MKIISYFEGQVRTANLCLSNGYRTTLSSDLAPPPLLARFMLPAKTAQPRAGFSLGFAAGDHAAHSSLMEMLPAALDTEGMSPVLGYDVYYRPVSYFIDRLLPHAHPQDLVQRQQPLPGSIKRTAILLTLGISSHNFPEAIATLSPPAANLELGFGIAPAVALHVIPEGLAVAGPALCRTLKRTAIFLGRCIPAWRKFWRRAGVADFG